MQDRRAGERRKKSRKFRVKFSRKFRGRVRVGGGARAEARGLYIWYIVLWIDGYWIVGFGST